LPEATDWIVDRQIELGVDIVNDGEHVKGWQLWWLHRRRRGWLRAQTGGSEQSADAGGVCARDRRDFPGT
jgi:5-methyltetrahydropteroyltriglutamate--homocysteine methyltransferase